jgi:hypothetical protein
MRFILEARIPIERGNAALRDPQFGQKMSDLLKEIGAEAAYFSTMDGQRGGYIVVNLNDASDLPKVAEPLFLWLGADITAKPVMGLEDLAKAGPAIGAAVKKWGS